MCPNGEAPSCPACDDGQICVQTTQSCDDCAQAICQRIGVEESSSDSGKPNVGAIAGGVIGGVAFIAVVVFVIWKFCLKGKRQSWVEEQAWNDGMDMSASQEKQDNDFASRRSTRASTHTVASMASSVLTRASNIIQIAYIPGVTNRSGPGSPDVLVPPVPPIPAMSPSSGLSSPYAASEQHFFVPDFRDSMASGSTDLRSSYARTSIAPSLARASVASTVYRQNAIVSPLPAQTIVRGKAAVVSVKSSGSNSPADTPHLDNTPPMPQIDPKHTVKPVRIQMPRMGSGASSLSPQNSVRSTATLGPVRALNITKKKSSDVVTPPKSSSSDNSNLTGSTAISDGNAVQPLRPLTEYSVTSSDDGVAHARARKAGHVDSDSDSDDDDHARARQSLLRNSDLVSEFSDSQSIADLRSPFSDQSSIDRPALPQRQTSRSSRFQPAPMTPIVEEAKRHSNASGKRTQSPFSDDHRSDL